MPAVLLLMGLYTHVAQREFICRFLLVLFLVFFIFIFAKSSSAKLTNFLVNQTGVLVYNCEHLGSREGIWKGIFRADLITGIEEADGKQAGATSKQLPAS